MPIKMQTSLVLSGLLHLSGAVSLSAQQYAAPFIRWEPPISSGADEPWNALQSDSSLGDYRYEGLAFGGLVFGALGVWVGSRVSGACPLEPGVPCNSDKTGQAVALGLVGAALGGGLGYLVGRFSPKRPSPFARRTAHESHELATLPDSIRERAGYQHWRGAGLGLAIGGALGALTGIIGTTAAQCDDCGQRPTAAEVILTTGLIGAGAGGVLGFLAGLASPKYVWIPRVGR